jgi:hypothetical protein
VAEAGRDAEDRGASLGRHGLTVDAGEIGVPGTDEVDLDDYVPAWRAVRQETFWREADTGSRPMSDW